MAYRFAAADTASEAFRPKAISWVLIGGIFAGIIGPQVVIFTKDRCRRTCLPRLISRSRLLAVLARGVLMFLDIPVPPRRPAEGEGRPLLRDRAAAAVHRRGRLRCRQLLDDEHGDDLGAARDGDVRSLGDARHRSACNGTCWACSCRASSPGRLIARFGVERIIAHRVCFADRCSATIRSHWHRRSGISGSGWSCSAFGWNFGFIGATTMVTQCHRPNERNRVQAFNDFLVFGSMAIGSFSSGKLLACGRLGSRKHGGVPGRAGGRRPVGMGCLAAAPRVGAGDLASRPRGAP